MQTNGLIKLVCGYREGFTGGSDIKMKPEDDLSKSGEKEEWGEFSG